MPKPDKRKKEVSTEVVRDILGVGDRKDPTTEITKVLDEKGLKPVEKVTVVNPITKKQTEIEIRRDGTPDSELAIVMADTNSSREKKDTILGMYLFERGKENASFLMELFQHKGQHTKSTQAFKAQMRFDFELFVSSFTLFLRGQSEVVKHSLGIGSSTWAFIKNEYVDYARRMKVMPSYKEVMDGHMGYERDEQEAMMIDLAIRWEEEADKLDRQVKQTTARRMMDKGFGIYVDRHGDAYSIFEKDIEDVIKRDKEEMKNDGDNKGASDAV